MKTKLLPPFVRECPKCKKQLNYANVKNRNRAEKNGVICHGCSMKEVNNTPGIGKIRIANRRAYSGVNNPFYGKNHSNTSKLKIVENRDFSKYKNSEFRNKISLITSGSKNPMFGKNVYDIWVLKYGKDKADTKMKEVKQKLSIANSGENNPMYGKPAPKGSGGGWSGWYKGWYFRSLRELSYMINVIEANEYQWRTGETISIPYMDCFGKNRTYRPDFIVNGKIIVEVKPLKLMITPNNSIKKIAAEKYCADNEMEYRMVDIAIIKKPQILRLINSGVLILTKKYIDRISNGN